MYLLLDVFFNFIVTLRFAKGTQRFAEIISSLRIFAVLGES